MANTSHLTNPAIRQLSPKMRTWPTIGFALLVLPSLVLGQSGKVTVKSGPPLIFGLSFQNFALPFHDMDSNFSHPGIFAGSEISLNKKGTLIGTAEVGYYHNRRVGNGFYAAPGFTFRQAIVHRFNAEAGIGAGWLRVYHPVQAYRFSGGDWQKTGGGKSQLIVPVVLGISYHEAFNGITPFLYYKIAPALFYDDALPVNFYGFVCVGARIPLIR